MPSGESRVLSPDVVPPEDQKSQTTKSSHSTPRASKNTRTTSNGTQYASNYVSPYRQTPRSAPSPATSTKTTPTQNPAHAAKFKNIVNRFNEKQDEIIPLPTNATAASRMSPTVKSRKPPETRKTPAASRPATKPTAKDSSRPKQNRSNSALGSHESKATSRASSRASTVSITGDVKSKRPSLAKSVEEGTCEKGHEDVVFDGIFTVQETEVRHMRSRSNVEGDRPQLRLQTEKVALRHRRSRSNVEVSSSPPKQQGLEHLTDPFRKTPSANSVDSPLSPVSPLSKAPLSQRKVNAKSAGNSTRHPLLNSPSVGREPAAKKSSLSSLTVSPHSSRHVPQPSKSPTLRAYVTAPPPKKSPPLRSSRPRAQISTTTSSPAAKQKFPRVAGTETPSSPISKSGGSSQNVNRTPTRAKKKIPELGSIDFAARRAAVQAAFNKSLTETAAKESQPKTVMKEPTIGKLRGTIEEEDEENLESPMVHDGIDTKGPVQETIAEENEDAENAISSRTDVETTPNIESGVADVPIPAIAKGPDTKANEPLSFNEPVMPSSSGTLTNVRSPTGSLPPYDEIAEGSFTGASIYQDEKKVLAESRNHSGGLDEENVEMAANVEMVERPASKRFSLSGLPSLKFDSLPPPRRAPGEETPISPFTRSLLTVGEPIKSANVPVIVTPDSPAEPRRPPPRLQDISEYLRPDSTATTEWADVLGDEIDSPNDGRDPENSATRGVHQQQFLGFTVGGVMYPVENRSFLGHNTVSSPVDSELYTPVDESSTILSFIDRYDEPREDFLSPYIDSPSEYATTIAGTEAGEDEDGEDEDEDEEDGYYEGDEDELSSCSSETMQSSSRPSAQGSEDWTHQHAHSASGLNRPPSPSTPRQSMEESSPLPPTPPPKDKTYVPPVPRKNSVPFVELPFTRSSSVTIPTPNRTPQHNPIALPEITTDPEPLGLAIRISSPISLVLDSHDLEPQGISNRPSRPSLEHSHTAPSKTPFSPPSSYYSDPDGSRRSSTFTPVASPRASEITLPSSLGASMRIPTNDSLSDQKSLTKRKNIMKELVDTEKAFFQDMTVTEEIYKGSANACSALTPDDVKAMFGNTDAIVQFSKAFQESLKAAVASVYVLKKPRSNINSSSVSLANSISGDENIRGSVVSELSFLSDDEKDRQTYVGEAFGEHLAKMEKVYGDYCKNHEAAVTRLQKLEQSQGVAIWLRVNTPILNLLL